MFRSQPEVLVALSTSEKAFESFSRVKNEHKKASEVKARKHFHV
jgi:hypothetical protein